MQDEADEDVEHGERSIVLMRHGIAEDAAPGQRDEARALTADGHARMKRIGRGLARAFPRAETIFASPLLRAQQTATWVSHGYDRRVSVETTNALVPGATPRDLAELLQTHPQRRLILVGHEPNLSTNLLALIRASASAAVEFKKGGAARVRLDAAGMGVLQWMLTPRLLAKLAGE